MSHHKHGHLRPLQGRGPISRKTLDPGHTTRSRALMLTTHTAGNARRNQPPAQSFGNELLRQRVPT
ncbi:hypothetical protein Taro_029868 [Colocasia esculenta]|uniref:Uncharacterized protein n=1 Tax=Colocasia esculenta TaxID=4460 RepID=A0A843VYH1_COLES|nr:hypothetical protein [Colocasia esculenta]